MPKDKGPQCGFRFKNETKNEEKMREMEESRKSRMSVAKKKETEEKERGQTSAKDRKKNVE